MLNELNVSKNMEFKDTVLCRHLRRSCASGSFTDGLFQRQPRKASDPESRVLAGLLYAWGASGVGQSVDGD